MKRIAFIVLLLVLWLATWKGGASPKAPAPDSVRASFVTTETTVLSTPGQNLVPSSKPALKLLSLKIIRSDA